MLEKPTRRIRRFRMRGQKCFKQLLPFKLKIAKTSGFRGNLTFLALRFVSRNGFQSSAPLIETVEFTAPFYDKFETFRFGNRPHFQKSPPIIPLRGAERHHHIFPRLTLPPALRRPRTRCARCGSCGCTSGTARRGSACRSQTRQDRALSRSYPARWR